MTTLKIIQLLRTGHTPIDVYPRWGAEPERVIVFVMYVKEKWIGAYLKFEECIIRAEEYWREERE